MLLRFKFSLWSLVFISSLSQAKLVRYKLEIDTKTANYTGKAVKALTINGQIPAPLISATVGDVLEVTVNNKMDKDSSIHWHGILLPNSQDGVPYLTTQPIRAGSSFTYRFKVKHPGTYWYHSHTGLQEQRGLYGPIIFHPPTGERVKASRDYVVVLSDWTDENPNQVLANLKKDGDWYALKKNSVQSWNRVIAHGSLAIKNRLYGAWTRMGPMDLSDVGYDLFLSNGKQTSSLYANPREKVRLRLINAAASSYFNTEFSGGSMLVVAADGVDIEPVKVKRLRLAIAETYDVIVQIPHKKSYEFRSTSEDGTGFSSVFIGEGQKILAPDIPRPNLFLTDHQDHSRHSLKSIDHKTHNRSREESHKTHNLFHQKSHKSRHQVSKHSHQNGHKSQHKTQDSFKKERHKTHSYQTSQNSGRNKLNQHHRKSIDASSTIDAMTDYRHLKSIHSTDFGPTHRKVVLRLTGNMERYVWTFNHKTLLESDKILIKKGETVRFVLVNETMMHHPLHLHGHFFRVLNGQGDKSPLKHTVNVPAMETVEIEFKASEEKDWFFHCHNLYHMKTGMSRVVSYEKSKAKKDKDLFLKLFNDSWYFFNDVSFMYNMIRGESRVSNTRNAFEVEYDYNYRTHYDFDLIYIRSFTRFLEVYGGISLESKSSGEKPLIIAGIRYVLPLLIEVDLQINSNKKLQLEFESSLQLTKRSRLDWIFDTDKEYRLEFSYEWNKNFLITAAYDSDFKQGAGIRFRF